MTLLDAQSSGLGRNGFLGAAVLLGGSALLFRTREAQARLWVRLYKVRFGVFKAMATFQAALVFVAGIAVLLATIVEQRT